MSAKSTVSKFGALTGATRLLAEKKPIIFLAPHGDEQVARCTAILGELRYRPYHLDGSVVVKYPKADEIYALPI